MTKNEYMACLANAGELITHQRELMDQRENLANETLREVQEICPVDTVEGVLRTKGKYKLAGVIAFILGLILGTFLFGLVIELANTLAQ